MKFNQDVTLNGPVFEGKFAGKINFDFNGVFKIDMDLLGPIEHF